MARGRSGAYLLHILTVYNNTAAADTHSSQSKQPQRPEQKAPRAATTTAAAATATEEWEAERKAEHDFFPEFSGPRKSQKKKKTELRRKTTQIA